MTYDNAFDFAFSIETLFCNHDLLSDYQLWLI
jgi:hypothetical protein